MFSFRSKVKKAFKINEEHVYEVPDFITPPPLPLPNVTKQTLAQQMEMTTNSSYDVATNPTAQSMKVNSSYDATKSTAQPMKMTINSSYDVTKSTVQPMEMKSTRVQTLSTGHYFIQSTLWEV